MENDYNIRYDADLTLIRQMKTDEVAKIHSRTLKSGTFFGYKNKQYSLRSSSTRVLRI